MHIRVGTGASPRAHIDPPARSHIHVTRPALLLLHHPPLPTHPRHTLTLKQPDEYEKLGSYALIGLPDDQYPTRYV